MENSTRNSGRSGTGHRGGISGNPTAILAFVFGLMLGAAGVGGVFTLAANMPASLAERSAGPSPTSAGVSLVTDVGERVRLVLERYPSARAGDPGWDLHRTLVVDLNGDGRNETVHVLASVERADTGDFMWDDGHVWNVYIEDEDGQVTEVFRGWVQLGELRVRSLDPFADNLGPGLLVLKEEGAGITMYRVFYDGPGLVRTEKLAGVSTWSEAW